MCLAIPGKIISFEDTGDSPLMAKVSFGGVIKLICMDWLPDTKIGEYVMVHAGFAISNVDENEAVKTLQMVKEMENQLNSDLNISEP
jgi:hydrogenase expression/formation protein HypC